MKFFIGSVATGKTHRIFKHVIKNGGILIANESMRLDECIKNGELKKEQVFTYHQVIKNPSVLKGRREKIYIDSIDNFLNELFEGNFGGGSLFAYPCLETSEWEHV